MAFIGHRVSKMVSYAEDETGSFIIGKLAGNSSGVHKCLRGFCV